MGLPNPIDAIGDAAGDIAGGVNKKKRQLVKYIANKATPSGPSIASGQSTRKPKYYTGRGGRILGKKRGR